MTIKLDRPIAFLDIEATGTNRELDRIVEISICKLFPNMDREVKTMMFNPGIPIPPTATLIHGISDFDVRHLSPFSAKAKWLVEYLEGCDIGGFNSNHYDVPMLFMEFNRAGIAWDYTKFRMVDAGNIYKINEPRTLTAAVKFYLGEEHDGAHGAEADVKATVDVFLAQLGRYGDMPKTMDELHLFCNHGKPMLDISGKFSFNENSEVIFNFGPHRGKKALLHPEFLDWMLNKADFPVDTKRIARDLREQYYQNQYAD